MSEHDKSTVDGLHKHLQTTKRVYSPSEMWGRAQKLETELTAANARIAELELDMSDDWITISHLRIELARLKAEGEKLIEIENGLLCLKDHILRGSKLKYQDGEFWIFREDGEGIYGGPNIIDVIIPPLPTPHKAGGEGE